MLETMDLDDNNNNKIEVYLDDDKIKKLDKIIKELYESNSIDSDSMKEFLDLTIFIVLYEYDKNKDSLKKFYSQNKEIYKQEKDNVTN
jgi:hypothetical protein